MKQVSAAVDALVWATEKLVGDKLAQPYPSTLVPPMKSLSRATQQVLQTLHTGCDSCPGHHLGVIGGGRDRNLPMAGYF